MCPNCQFLDEFRGVPYGLLVASATISMTFVTKQFVLLYEFEFGPRMISIWKESNLLSHVLWSTGPSFGV